MNMQAEYKKIIKVSPESCAKLAALHNCSKQSVYAALAYNTHSSLAGRIRMDALHVLRRIAPKKLVFYYARMQKTRYTRVDE